MSGTELKNGRYLLLLDILGFSELVESKPAAEIYAIINDALKEFERWEDLNRLFRTIYYSDTFVFYQEPKGYGAWAFLDVYAIGSVVLSALLARGIAARGAITFGEFEVDQNESGNHSIYFGRALIEAYRAEQRENWIGIAIQPSAWRPYEAEEPGTVAAFANEGVWLRRDDDVLLLNPFRKLRGWYQSDLTGEIEAPYLEWDKPEFPNDIRAFRYLREKASFYAARGDFTGKVAMKYHATIAFLRAVLGTELYEWASRISEADRDVSWAMLLTIA